MFKLFNQTGMGVSNEYLRAKKEWRIVLKIDVFHFNFGACVLYNRHPFQLDIKHMGLDRVIFLIKSER